MMLLSVALPIATLTSGIIAAWLWWKASRVTVIPLWAKHGGIEPVGGSDSQWVSGILEVLEESSRLNKKAAIWTAVSVATGSAVPIVAWFLG